MIAATPEGVRCDCTRAAIRIGHAVRQIAFDHAHALIYTSSRIVSEGICRHALFRKRHALQGRVVPEIAYTWVVHAQAGNGISHDLDREKCPQNIFLFIGENFESRTNDL